MSSVWCCIDYVKAGIPSYRIRITSIISCCGLVCVSVRYWCGPVNLLLFHRDEYPAVPGFKSYLVIGTKYVVVGIDTSYHQPVYHPLQGKK